MLDSNIFQLINSLVTCTEPLILIHIHLHMFITINIIFISTYRVGRIFMIGMCCIILKFQLGLKTSCRQLA